MQTKIENLKTENYFGKIDTVFSIQKLKEYIQLSKQQAKIYILSYFCKNATGDSVFMAQPRDYADGYDISTIENLNKVVYSYLEKSDKLFIQNFFDKEVNDNYKITSDPRSDRFYMIEKTEQNYINLSNGFLHKGHKEYKSFSNKIKNDNNTVLKHIKSVWCSNNDASFNYVLNWLAGALTGHKQETALFLKSNEGTGKSIIISWMIENVIGRTLGLITSRTQQLFKFNGQLLGKILVCLEEMATSSKAEWHTVGEYLKDLITGGVIDIEKKFQDAIQVVNLISLIIFTNNENTIKFGKDIRRYMMCDVSHDFVGNTTYFENLAKSMTPESGEAFYYFLLEHYEKNKDTYKVENIPMTEAKMEMKDKNSSKIIEYIKLNYVKKGLGIKQMKLADLKDKYNYETGIILSTQSFRTSLCADIPIFKIIEDNKKGHKIEQITKDNLYNWYLKKGFWNIKYDNFENDDDENITTEEKEEENIIEVIDYKSLYEKAIYENERLKAEILDLKEVKEVKPVNKLQIKKVVKKAEPITIKQTQKVVDDNDDLEKDLELLLADKPIIRKAKIEIIEKPVVVSKKIISRVVESDSDDDNEPVKKPVSQKVSDDYELVDIKAEDLNVDLDNFF